MDSTIVVSETIDELAVLAGYGPEVSSITKRSMNGEIDFNEAIHERVAMLSGLRVNLIDHILAEIKLSKGAETLVRTMAAHGALTVLVSGGFKNFSEPVARMVGFDQNHANRLEIENDLLTGKVINPILGPDAKRKTLITASSKFGASISETLAIGDGANDVPMIQAAGLGIAYRGKPITRDSARAILHTGTTGACIDYADLTAALFFQGYQRRQFSEHG
jgi:phosphoserine phosphatase